jgi:hypothetical protein
MTFPTIHGNGTSPEQLMANYKAAAEAIRAAQAALQDCSPNGRDYYPQGPDAISKAVEEFREHQLALERAYAYLGLQWESVIDQQDSRR